MCTFITNYVKHWRREFIVIMVSTTHKLKLLAHLLYVYKSVFFYFNSLAYVVLSYIAFPVYVCSHVTGAYLLYGRSLQGAVQRSRWVDQMSFYANLQEPRQLQTPNNFHRTSEQKYNKLFTQHMTKCTSWLNHLIQNRINGIFSSCSFVKFKVKWWSTHWSKISSQNVALFFTIPFVFFGRLHINAQQMYQENTFQWYMKHRL